MDGYIKYNVNSVVVIRRREIDDDQIMASESK